MREIKFRGKTLSGKWVYGDLVHFTNTEGVDASVIITEHQATAESDDFDYALCYARNEFKIVIPESVGQFTGLHDKNGKEIYEGDILRDPHSGEVGVVEWSTMWLQYWLSICNSPSKAGLPFFVALGYAVVGNIHDNPYLDID